MYRSWAYILMILATLVGVVALVWPSPQVQTIEQIASVTKDVAPRAEPPAKAAKPAARAAQASKAAKPAAAPAPPAIVKKMTAPNTTTRRAGPLLQNGLEVPPLGKPLADRAPSDEPPKLAAPATARPPVPPRPAPPPPHAASKFPRDTAPK